MLDLKELHHTVETWTCVVSLLLNVVSLYTILYKSSLKLRNYRSILLITCITDVFLCCTTLLTQPVFFITSDASVLVVSNGLSLGESAFDDHMVLAIHITFMHISVVCVILQYTLRHFMVCTDERFAYLRKHIVGFCIFWCVVQMHVAMWTFVFGYTDEAREHGLRHLRDFGWTVDNSSAAFPLVLRGTKAKVHHGFFVVTYVAAAAVVVWCQYEIWDYFRRNYSGVKEGSRNMHAEVNRALVAQATTSLLPLLGLLILFVYSLISSSHTDVASTLASVAASLPVLINPLATIGFIHQYRDAVFTSLKEFAGIVDCSRLTDSVVHPISESDRKLQAFVNQGKPPRPGPKKTVTFGGVQEILIETYYVIPYD